MKLEDIQKETSRDVTLQAVMKAIQTGNWHKYSKEPSINTTAYQSMARVKEEFAIVEDKDDAKRKILLRGRRLVIPKSLQDRVISLAHEGHQGIGKTKQLIREKVWFSGIDLMVERTCRECIMCQAATPKTESAPLEMTELPLKQWDNISVDHIGPFPDGKHVLVMIDDYSRFPVVEVVRSTSTNTTISQMDKIFSILGIPSIVKSDNGPAFRSKEFAQFAEYLGFKHRKITPLWPQANGEVENFNKTLGKAIKIAAAENKNWQQEMHKFLRNYRATPHCTTKIPPATALFGENIKTRIPEMTVPKDDDETQQNDQEAKEKMKMYADRKSKPCTLETGDTVLIKQPKENKLSTPFNPKPCKVVSRKGTMITAQQGSRTITRNCSHFKPVTTKVEVEEEEEKSENELEESETKESEHATSDSPASPRRSSRVKKTPSYLEDYVRK